MYSYLKKKRNQQFNVIFIFEILIILNVVIIWMYLYFTDQCSCTTLMRIILVSNIRFSKKKSIIFA